jgi:hypothetical protein
MSGATTESRSVVSDRVVVRFAQILTFAAAMAIFPLALFATIKFATSPFEVFIGVVLGGILACAIVIIGLVTPSAFDVRRA